jgi:hypothetical protein
VIGDRVSLVNSQGQAEPATLLFHRLDFSFRFGRAFGCVSDCRDIPLPEPRARTTNDARKAARARSTSFASQGKPPAASRRAPCVRVDTHFPRSIARPPDSFSRLF